MFIFYFNSKQKNNKTHTFILKSLLCISLFLFLKVRTERMSLVLKWLLSCFRVDKHSFFTDSGSAWNVNKELSVSYV